MLPIWSFESGVQSIKERWMVDFSSRTFTACSSIDFASSGAIFVKPRLKTRPLIHYQVAHVTPWSELFVCLCQRNQGCDDHNSKAHPAICCIAMWWPSFATAIFRADWSSAGKATRSSGLTSEADVLTLHNTQGDISSMCLYAKCDETENEKNWSFSFSSKVHIYISQFVKQFPFLENYCLTIFEYFL